MLLPDPREYATLSPKNNLVQATLAWLEYPDASHLAAVHFLLEQALEQGDDKLPGIALSLMPSQSAYAALWQQLVAKSWQGGGLCPFVLPLVLVAGSPVPVALGGELLEVASLRDTLQQHGALPAESWICNRLVTASSLQALTPATLFAWSRQTGEPHLGWPELPAAAPLLGVQQEAAYLRFLPGLCRVPTDWHWQNTPKGWGQTMMQQVSMQLARDGATVLALPRAPLPVLAGLDEGRKAQAGIALQLWLGNALRQLREQGLNPVAELATTRQHQLRLRLLAPGAEPLSFMRPLEALDDLALLEQEYRLLLVDCRVEEVQVLAECVPV
jgi:hypothetical protein